MTEYAEAAALVAEAADVLRQVADKLDAVAEACADRQPPGPKRVPDSPLGALLTFPQASIVTDLLARAEKAEAELAALRAMTAPPGTDGAPQPAST